MPCPGGRVGGGGGRWRKQVVWWVGVAACGVLAARERCCLPVAMRQPAHGARAQAGAPPFSSAGAAAVAKPFSAAPFLLYKESTVVHAWRRCCPSSCPPRRPAPVLLARPPPARPRARCARR